MSQYNPKTISINYYLSIIINLTGYVEGRLCGVDLDETPYIAQ